MSQYEAEPLRLPDELQEEREHEKAIRLCAGGAGVAAGMLGPSRLGPGPAIFDGGSCFGEQVVSTIKTAGCVGFGTDQRGKDTATNTKDGPGPAGYNMPTLLGQMADSRMRSAPSYTQAGRELFGSTMNPKQAAKEPGPGDYNTPSGNPRHPRSPKYSIARRHPDAAQRERKPGPGAYGAPDGTGNQPLSTRTTAARTRIGNSLRPSLHEGGRDNPNGPGAYPVPSTVGTQVLSSHPSSPIYGFGTSTRPAPNGKVRHAPGPGRYNAPASIGPQPMSTKPTNNAIRIKGRVAFGSPYGV